MTQENDKTGPYYGAREQEISFLPAYEQAWFTYRKTILGLVFLRTREFNLKSPKNLDSRRFPFLSNLNEFVPLACYTIAASFHDNIIGHYDKEKVDEVIVNENIGFNYKRFSYHEGTTSTRYSHQSTIRNVGYLRTFFMGGYIISMNINNPLWIAVVPRSLGIEFHHRFLTMRTIRPQELQLRCWYNLDGASLSITRFFYNKIVPEMGRFGVFMEKRSKEDMKKVLSMPEALTKKVLYDSLADKLRDAKKTVNSALETLQKKYKDEQGHSIEDVRSVISDIVSEQHIPAEPEQEPGYDGDEEYFEE